MAKVTPEDLADILRAQPDYHGGPIRLLSCFTAYGENSFAQRLANIMDVHVKGSPGFLIPSVDGHHLQRGMMFNFDGSGVPEPTDEIVDWIVKKPAKRMRD